MKFTKEEKIAYVASQIIMPWTDISSWISQRVICDYGVSGVLLEDESSYYYHDVTELIADITMSVRGIYYLNKRHEAILKELGFDESAWESLRIVLPRDFGR